MHLYLCHSCHYFSERQVYKNFSSLQNELCTCHLLQRRKFYTISQRTLLTRNPGILCSGYHDPALVRAGLRMSCAQFCVVCVGVWMCVSVCMCVRETDRQRRSMTSRLLTSTFKYLTNDKQVSGTHRPVSPESPFCFQDHDSERGNIME